MEMYYAAADITINCIRYNMIYIIYMYSFKNKIGIFNKISIYTILLFFSHLNVSRRCRLVVSYDTPMTDVGSLSLE